MSRQLYEKVTAYRTAISVVKRMLKLGIITPEEYSKIDTIIADKYGLSSGTIFR